MPKPQIAPSALHQLPADIKKILTTKAEVLEKWNSLTPLARNEWICWIESAKKADTRRKRLDWGRASLIDGKRRPCCWPGCPHR